MFWLHCGLFVLVIAVPGFISSADSASKREADYTLDDSFWNEETPAGEVERLLREYRQNQELVRNTGSNYYQIIYPVQLRHHEKMGISTREVGESKYPQRGYGGEGGYQNTRGRSRTGRHFHRTSLLIKAFSHKFRLDLELNTQLLAPNLAQKDFLPSGAEQVSKQEIEHCYYHGIVRDYPGASAAFHTCDGVSGVIHLGNETFVIHPFYGGDLSKHPHVIFEARTKTNKGCANSGGFERHVKNRRQKHVLGLLSGNLSDRYKRDVREATKYIETAIVIDKAMFEKRNGSSRAEVVHDAIQVANIADLYFRTLNTRVSVVYIETWQGGNQAVIDKDKSIDFALQNFNDYTMRRMYQTAQDTAQLLTGETFAGGELGVAAPGTICSPKSVGISVDLNIYEPHLLAGTMAHMIGHNIGMDHDDGRNDCNCRDWHGCIMAQSIVGLENVQPYKFSECSKDDYIDVLRSSAGLCLLNKPNQVEIRRTCGNRVIDEGEQCDCGSITDCQAIDPCCDPITCKLTKEAECASGPCCSDCKLRARGVICRDSTNECDLPEVCTGESGQCPADVYKKNGNPCANNEGYCFNGICPALDLQCDQVWGYSGIAADQQCFEQFNSKGSISGHCGTDASGHFIKCDPKNVRCGSLQCQLGNKQPVMGGMNQQYSITIISIKSREYECKATTGKVEGSEMPEMGLVRDGTSCGDNLICVNQTCTSRFPYIDQEQCPSNHNNNECSGNGVCTNVNKCYCHNGWSGPDCSIQQDIPTALPTTTSTAIPGKTKSDNTQMEKKETPYEAKNDNLSTGSLVLILVAVVKSVFVCFALMAVCYRRKSTVQKYDPPYSLKPPQKSYSGVSRNHHPEVAALDSVNKILTFGSMPQCSRGESQRVLFRPLNNVDAVDAPRLKEHKSQVKRNSGDEEDGGPGVEEAVSFIDLGPNQNVTKFPEKGILKKHGGYGLGSGGPMSSVKCTFDTCANRLNQLNGYHEDLVEALEEGRRKLSSTLSGSANLLVDDGLRKSLTGERGYGTDGYRKDNDAPEDDDDDVHSQQPCDPIRIRNLEDIIRQLEHHSVRHMSPSESEEIRISESDPDRHYRIDSSVCSESSQGSRRCSRVRDDDGRFGYGRYRQPSSRSPYGSHQHGHQHSHQMHEEESIYETADPDRGSNTRGETPDSDSDAFIQAQRPSARWTSEEKLDRRPPQQPPPPPPPPSLPPPPSPLPSSPPATLEKSQPIDRGKIMGNDTTSLEQLPLSRRGFHPPTSSPLNPIEKDEGNVERRQGISGHCRQGILNHCQEISSNCKRIPNHCQGIQSHCQEISSNCKRIPNHCQGIQSHCKEIPNHCQGIQSHCQEISSNCKRIPNHCQGISNHCQEIPNHCQGIQSHCQEISSNCKRIPNHCKEISNHCQEIPNHCKEIPNHCQEIPNHCQEISNHCQEISNHCQEIPTHRHEEIQEIPSHCRQEIPTVRQAGNAQSQPEVRPLPRGIDVIESPNITNYPLDGNLSLDCTINNESPDELNTKRTSDNENTALINPARFPEYEH